MAVGTCKTAALGKGQELVKSTLCSSFLAEVGGGSPLLPPGNSWRRSLPSAQWPFPTLKVNFTDKARPGPAPTGLVGGGGRGAEAALVRAAGAGTEQAIDIQGPKWNPVRRGQKGEGRKGGGAVPDTPLCRACRGAWVFSGRGSACQAAPGSPEVAQSPAPLVLVGGPSPYFSLYWKGTQLDFFFVGWET